MTAKAKELLKDLQWLACYPTGDGQVKAWCPFCHKWHLHGYPDPITRAGVIGHRNAHCEKRESPFHKGGYALRLMTKAELQEIGASASLFEPKESR